MRLPPFRVLEGDQPGLEASGGVGVEVGAGAQSFDRFGLGIDRENAPAAAKQLERVSALAAAEIDGEPLAPAALALEQVECEAQCLPRPTALRRLVVATPALGHRQARTAGGCFVLTITFWPQLLSEWSTSRRSSCNPGWLGRALHRIALELGVAVAFWRNCDSDLGWRPTNSASGGGHCLHGARAPSARPGASPARAAGRGAPPRAPPVLSPHSTTRARTGARRCDPDEV